MFSFDTIISFDVTNMAMHLNISPVYPALYTTIFYLSSGPKLFKNCAQQITKKNVFHTGSVFPKLFKICSQ